MREERLGAQVPRESSFPGAPVTGGSRIASRPLGHETAKASGGGQGAEQKTQGCPPSLHYNWIFGEMALSSLQGELLICKLTAASIYPLPKLDLPTLTQPLPPSFRFYSCSPPGSPRAPVA